MLETMSKILRNIRNSFLIVILCLGFSIKIWKPKIAKMFLILRFKKKTISHKKKYSLNLVNSKDGHPVRSGKKSYRFEVRLGDCGKDKKYR